MNPGDNTINIRDALEQDMDAVQLIYGWHVEQGIASFEETPPDTAEITMRMKQLKDDGYPYRVAELGGIIRGYSYAGRYRPRPAYRYTVENSIYVDAQSTGMGIGGALLKDLIAECTRLGFRQMVAVIGDTGNIASINLHAVHGFENTGTLRSLGFKHGRWIDQVLMQLPLGEGDKTLP